jgi:DNA-binding transcriptional ArsR family regulator
MNVRSTSHRRKTPLASDTIEQGAVAAEVFLKALANRTRLLLLCSLVDGEASVGDLTLRLGLTQPNVSQHLAKMRGLGLVTTRRVGTTIYYRIADDGVAPIVTTLYEKFCGA